MPYIRLAEQTTNPDTPPTGKAYFWFPGTGQFIKYIDDAGTITTLSPGATGATGATGAAGADGKTVLNGAVDPTTEGVNGDFYINTTSDFIFGPKASGTWPAGVSLVGPTGATGSAGAAGADGKTVLNGTVDPTTEGVNGDFYINTATDFIFGPKAAGTWPAGVSLVGPTGATGATGAGADDGDKGDITVSGTGTVWTIDNNVVTYAKMQDVSATDRLLGRSTSGAGDVEEITCTAAGRALLDDATAAAQRTTLLVTESLIANRTYFVRTDGSDSNDGLANTSGGAFLTIQKAINVVSNIIIGEFNVTIDVADGTYTGSVTVNGPWLGKGFVTVRGNTTTPTNVVISTTGNCFSLSNGARLTVTGMRLVSSGSSALFATSYSMLTGSSSLVFGTCGLAHAYAYAGGFITVSASYTIAGNAVFHVLAQNASQTIISGVTVTLTGTPAFAAAYAGVSRASVFDAATCTFSGAATGTRFTVSDNGVIFTNGGGATYLPGNAAGSTSTGGQYV